MIKHLAIFGIIGTVSMAFACECAPASVSESSKEAEIGGANKCDCAWSGAKNYSKRVARVSSATVSGHDRAS